jgi:hypothetical protein
MTGLGVVFHSPVFPGEVIDVATCPEAVGKVGFEARVGDRKVLGSGMAQFAA